MKQIIDISLERTTQGVAIKAREFADSIPASVTGKQALNMFADAIDAANAMAFPKGDAH